MTYPRCQNPSEACPRDRRWSRSRGGWLWVCGCGRAFPEHTPGVAAATPLRGDIDARIQCPVCGSGMVPVRGTRNGDFWSCSRYPACTGKRQAEGKK